MLPAVGDQPGREHPLKPLAALYGEGTGADSADTHDKQFQPLLMNIEETFYSAHGRAPSLADGAVLAVLDRPSMSPDADFKSEPLGTSVQNNLRLLSSFNDYSRQDVRMALRKVRQSVVRHNKAGGIRG